MSTILITGASRGLGLGFVRQALERDKYTLILAATRKKDPRGELAKLEESTQGRVRMVCLREVSDRDACVEMAEEVASIAKEGVQVLVNNAGHATQPKPMTPLRLPTIEGALDYHRTWSINAFGPLLVSSALLDHDLLRLPSSDPASALPRPERTPIGSVLPPPLEGTKVEYPTTLPSSHLLSKISMRPAPKIVNISSLQASLGWASEIWTGGADRDDLFFHPVYAASKVALAGVTVHMARILRNEVIVGAVQPGWLKTTMGRTYANLTVDEASSKVLNIVDTWRTLRDSGQYVDEENRKIPW